MPDSRRGYFRAFLPTHAMSHLYYEGHCLDLWHSFATLKAPKAGQHIYIYIYIYIYMGLFMSICCATCRESSRLCARNPGTLGFCFGLEALFHLAAGHPASAGCRRNGEQRGDRIPTRTALFRAGRSHSVSTCFVGFPSLVKANNN